MSLFLNYLSFHGLQHGGRLQQRRGHVRGGRHGQQSQLSLQPLQVGQVQPQQEQVGGLGDLGREVEAAEVAAAEAGVFEEAGQRQPALEKTRI